MKNLILMVAAAAGMLSSAAPVLAADRVVMLPLAAAMADNDAKTRLGEGVRFYFGSQPTPAVQEKLGSDKTSQKTNAFGKSDEKACNWAFLSAMLSLQKRAQNLGANAVTNIVSNYNNVEHSSPTEFECHAGAIMAGVALKGDFVKIAN
ncbi:excinuclease ATPase subunit [Collimonas pratensis]|uniref:excinuclease ATPase subunit n=1 Tax=Collimonas pratensis TaxID=279113 RepID=UPI00143D97BB|nr:excinuclease ATPase subunit [Collimonas pratensis]NKI72498.1 excinuclease ATPase subunit [Collimonas pratensis]